MTVAKNYVLPQDPGITTVKPRCCGLGQRKLAIISIVTIILFILAVYTLCRSSETRMLKVEDLLEEETQREDYTKLEHRLPGCIIIGMRKGGTRALLNFLQLHPKIITSGKEVHYFDKEANFFQGINWYLKQLPLSYGDQITIEKTPAYFHSSEAPRRIFRMNSTIKLILVVREPLERAVSDYLQLYDKRARQNLETFSFEEKAIRQSGGVNANYKPVERSVYHQFMKHWLKYFPLQQMLVVDSVNLVRKPYEVVKSVETFLGLEHKVSKDSFVYDRRKGFFCIKNETTGHKCLNKKKGRPHPKIDSDVEEKLKEYFEPYNKIFFDQVGQTFHW